MNWEDYSDGEEQMAQQKKDRIDKEIDENVVNREWASLIRLDAELYKRELELKNQK